MTHVLLLLGAFLAAWVPVYLLGPRVVEFCRKVGLVVDITHRDSHSLPTPHGGGILLVALGVPLALAAVWLSSLPFKLFLTVMLVASLIVAWDGWRDDRDRHAVNQLSRLMAQLVAVGMGVALLPPLFDFAPLWLEKLVLIVGWVWFINLFNFMNGADGLAESEAMFLGLAVGILVPPFAPLGFILAGLGAGFLRVNWHPARVFLGDVGSTWLGYVLGGLLLVTLVDDTWRYLWPMGTLALAFCLDATSTLIRRVLQGHKPWEPHKTFWFHRTLALGWRHDQLVWALWAVNGVLFACAAMELKSGLKASGLLAGLSLLFALMYAIRRIENIRKETI